MADVKIKQVNVRFTDTEYLRLQALAIDRDMSVQDALRALVLGLDDAGDGPMGRAVEESLSAVAPEARDVGAQQLARQYARLLDEDPDTYSDLGPKLLATLNALGLTPAGRKVKPADPTGGVPAAKSAAAQMRDEVAEQRAKREAGGA